MKLRIKVECGDDEERDKEKYTTKITNTFSSTLIN